MLNKESAEQKKFECRSLFKNVSNSFFIESFYISLKFKNNYLLTGYLDAK